MRITVVWSLVFILLVAGAATAAAPELKTEDQKTLYALGVALLMVSRVPYPHLVNQLFRGRRSFNHIVSVVFALVAVMIIRSYSVPMICCAFVLLGPLRYVWRELILPLRRPTP